MATKYVVEPQRDLFGRVIERRKSRFQSELENFDRNTLPDRSLRLKWIHKVFPNGYEALMPLETHFVFVESKMAFINGEFISTILLANAFNEHWLGCYLQRQGYYPESQRGLKSIIQCLTANSLLHEYLISRVDGLREQRNPLAHLHPPDRPDTLHQRMMHQKRDLADILEAGAKNAISIMYEVFVACP